MASETLTDLLRAARKASRLSQLELSLRLGVSQRHVSFVESGRARPSVALLVEWLDALEMPLSLRDRTLVLAGYAPRFAKLPLDHGALAMARRAIAHLLASANPNPAVLIDADWNVLDRNAAASWLATQLMPGGIAADSARPLNLLDALVDPAGTRRFLANFDEVLRAVLRLVRHEVVGNPALADRLAALERLAREAGRGRPSDDGADAPGSPVVASRFATPLGELCFFSMFTTFGSPYDITLASLRVEHWFPANPATAALLQAHVCLSGRDESGGA